MVGIRREHLFEIMTYVMILVRVADPNPPGNVAGKGAEFPPKAGCFETLNKSKLEVSI